MDWTQCFYLGDNVCIAVEQPCYFKVVLSCNPNLPYLVKPSFLFSFGPYQITFLIETNYHGLIMIVY